MAGLLNTRLGKFVKAMAVAKVLTVEYAAYNQSVLTKMANLNTDVQLYEQGLFPDGTSTPDYAQFTIQKKQSKGQRYDHMTFRDTEVTHNSVIYLFNGDLVADWNDHNDIMGYLLDKGIDSNPIGLTGESKSKLRPEISENIVDYIKSKL